MARSIRDDMKRRVAQACNHLATAILQVNDVYEEFAKAQKPEAAILGDVIQDLAQRQAELLSFAEKAWGLDAAGLQVFM